MTNFYNLWVASEASRNLDLQFLTMLVLVQFGLYWLIGRYVEPRFPKAQFYYLVSAIGANVLYALWIGLTTWQTMSVQ